jgi:arylsulfatase A-like enzyme
MTGRYQERAGIPGVGYADPGRAEHYPGLQPGEVTLPETLAATGYTSALMGKWHLGYLPEYNPVHHGFDTFRGFVSGNVDYLSHFDQSGAYDWWHDLELVEEPGYSTHLINRHAIEFIKNNRDRPFLLYVAHEAVHTPFQGPGSQIERGPLAGKREGAVTLSQTEAYVQMMGEMDRGVGEILDTLDALDLSADTFVFFFSDNGPAGNAPGGPETYSFPLRGHKNTVWEGGHRVPAIARWPGKVQPGSINDGLFISLDVMPTILELAATALPDGHFLDGTSLVDALLNGSAVEDRALFWRGEAMRQGHWKLVGGPDGGLYNLSTDLPEQYDLSAKYPERVEAMQTAMAQWQQDVAEGATVQPAPPAEAGIEKESP